MSATNDTRNFRVKFMPIKYYETFLSASNKQHINLSYVIEVSTHGELSVNEKPLLKLSLSMQVTQRFVLGRETWLPTFRPVPDEQASSSCQHSSVAV